MVVLLRKTVRPTRAQLGPLLPLWLTWPNACAEFGGMMRLSDTSPQGIPALAIVIICAIVLGNPFAAAQEQVVQIRLTHRQVADVLPAAEPLVSPSGFISADQRTNSLIVIDNPDTIARIQRLVEELDREVALLKIRVQYANSYTTETRQTEPAPRDKAPEAAETIDNEHLPDGSRETNLSEGHTQKQRLSEYVIRVRSGSIAYIEAGYDVPHRKRWQQLSHRYGYVPPTTVFQKVASGYNVRPVLTGDQVQIEITPRINYFDNRGRDQKIFFIEAATTLFAPLGEWVDIGGVMGGHREINRQILADSRHMADQGLTMRLMVTID